MILGLPAGFFFVMAIGFLVVIFFALLVIIHSNRIAERVFLAVVVTAVAVLAAAFTQKAGILNSLGNPAEFNQLSGGTYEVGNPAGAEGTFWISSKDGSRIFENVPKKLRKKGVRFISIDGDKIIVIRDEFVPKSPK